MSGEDETFTRRQVPSTPSIPLRGGDRRGVDTAGRRMHAETQDKLRHHLEECSDCLRHYGVEERVKRLIAHKCSGEKAPEGCGSGCGSRSAAPSSAADGASYELGALAVVCLRVLAIALLAATLGHGNPPCGQGFLQPASGGRVWLVSHVSARRLSPRCCGSIERRSSRDEVG